MDRREELIKSATDFVAVIDDFSKEFQEDAIPLMADFAQYIEQAVIRRIVKRLKQIDQKSDGYDVFSDMVREYLSELEKEINDAGN